MEIKTEIPAKRNEENENGAHLQSYILLWPPVGLVSATSAADQAMMDRICAVVAIIGDQKYVFVSGGKVRAITNQDDPNSMIYAGRTVKRTSAENGPTITVSKVGWPAAKKRAEKVS